MRDRCNDLCGECFTNLRVLGFKIGKIFIENIFHNTLFSPDNINALTHRIALSIFKSEVDSDKALLVV